MRVANVRPSTIPPFEEVTGLIKEILLRDKALALAREAGKAALAKVQASASARDSEGFAPAEVVSRQDPRQLAPHELSAVMNQPAQSVPAVIGLDTLDGYAVIDVQSFQPGAALPQAERQAFNGQLAQAWGRAEELAALAILRQVYEVKLLPDARKLIQDGSGS